METDSIKATNKFNSSSRSSAVVKKGKSSVSLRNKKREKHSPSPCFNFPRWIFFLRFPPRGKRNEERQFAGRDPFLSFFFSSPHRIASSTVFPRILPPRRTRWNGISRWEVGNNWIGTIRECTLSRPSFPSCFFWILPSFFVSSVQAAANRAKGDTRPVPSPPLLMESDGFLSRMCRLSNVNKI